MQYKNRIFYIEITIITALLLMILSVFINLWLALFFAILTIAASTVGISENIDRFNS